VSVVIEGSTPNVEEGSMVVNCYEWWPTQMRSDEMSALHSLERRCKRE
jgi:hypothetical protein